jgi:hypothetical protein
MRVLSLQLQMRCRIANANSCCRWRWGSADNHIADHLVSSSRAGQFHQASCVPYAIQTIAFAAPFAAYATRRIPDQPLMILVAMVIVLLSVRGLIQALS